jgi:hypothetical protein
LFHILGQGSELRAAPNRTKGSTYAGQEDCAAGTTENPPILIENLGPGQRRADPPGRGTLGLKAIIE